MNEPVSNTPELSVSELSGALKRTVEDAFGHVRLRGEISGYRGPHSSGHVYFSLKDANAKIDAVMWKGVFTRVKFRPEDGLEVIATGKITTFPGKSSYQIIVEQMEPAGVGALMALLEERKRKLNAEGLFDPARKQLIPYLPEVIGVITSPTGAVIRDVLHRLADRFPRHVLCWPVRVQGEGSAEEVANAIRGFNALPPKTGNRFSDKGDGEEETIPRPDVLIVARGGGSLEDLWGFNEESVVRAAASSDIPLISAVGHETDWTLLDLVADMRAPTPTAAAEMAVPVRAELLATTRDRAARLSGASLRLKDRRRRDLAHLVRALPDAQSLLAGPRQRLDLALLKRQGAFEARLARRRLYLSQLARRLGAQTPEARLARMREQLNGLGRQFPRLAEAIIRARRERLSVALQRGIQGMMMLKSLAKRDFTRQKSDLDALEQRRSRAWHEFFKRHRARLDSWEQLLASFSYKNVLTRGFALVRDATDNPIRSASAIASGQRLSIEFADGEVQATASGMESPKPSAKPASRPLRAPPAGQGDLF